MLFLAPDGHLMQWTTDDLAGTPFSNYLIPGIILFICNVLFPAFVFIGLMRKPQWQWPDVVNPLRDHHWARTASLASGIILLIWIISETAVLGYISFLQPVMGIWGVLILGLALVPSVQRYYRKQV